MPLPQWMTSWKGLGNSMGNMANAVGNRLAPQPQGPNNDEMFGQWLRGQMPGQIPQQQVKDQMRQSLMRIKQLLGQGEQRIRASIKQMAQKHNFSTSDRSYATKPVAGMQQQGDGRYVVGAGMRGPGTTQMMAHHFPEGEVLFELANFFDRWDEECCNELANCAYYTHNLLCELDASMAATPVQPQQQVVAAPAQVQGANVPQAAAQMPQQAAPQADDLRNLFGNIMQSVTNEFKQLLQYLQQAGVLST